MLLRSKQRKMTWISWILGWNLFSHLLTLLRSPAAVSSAFTGIFEYSNNYGLKVLHDFDFVWMSDLTRASVTTVKQAITFLHVGSSTSSSSNMNHSLSVLICSSNHCVRMKNTMVLVEFVFEQAAHVSCEQIFGRQRSSQHWYLWVLFIGHSWFFSWFFFVVKVVLYDQG